MSALLLLVLPLLAEGSLLEVSLLGVPLLEVLPVKAPLQQVPQPDGGNCGLPPASTERFDECNPAGNTWYVQYQYRVPGLFDMGCITYHLTQGNIPTEVHINASFSRFPKFPMEGKITMNGNRFQLEFYGIWGCTMSGPYNIVDCGKDFYIVQFCFIGYEVSQIFTNVKNPSKELMMRIWQAVKDHPALDKNKFVKAVC